MLGIIHVDEIDDDDAAQVAQAKLPRHRLRRLQVGAVDGLFQIALAEERTGVDVDGGHRLGLVDDQVAAGFQRHLLVQRAADFVLDAIQIEDGALAAVVFDALGQHRHVFGRERLQPFAGLARIDPHLLDVAAHQIAHRAQRQGQVLVDAGAHRGVAAALLHQRPDPRQVGNILGQRLGRLALGIGADDVAVAAVRGRQIRHQRLQALAFGLVLDTRRNAHHLGLRQQHQIARGNADLRGQARALAADGILDHLHHHVLAVAQQIHDRHRRRRRQRRLDRFAVGDRRRPHDVVGMQERRAIQADLDERRLHPRHHPLHLALVQVADHAAAPTTLDVQFLQHAVLDDGDTGLAWRDIDQDFFAHVTVRRKGKERKRPQRPFPRWRSGKSAGDGGGRLRPRRPSRQHSEGPQQAGGFVQR